MDTEDPDCVENYEAEKTSSAAPEDTTQDVPTHILTHPLVAGLLKSLMVYHHIERWTSMYDALEGTVEFRILIAKRNRSAPVVNKYERRR